MPPSLRQHQSSELTAEQPLHVLFSSDSVCHLPNCHRVVRPNPGPALSQLYRLIFRSSSQIQRRLPSRRDGSCARFQRRKSGLCRETETWHQPHCSATLPQSQRCAYCALRSASISSSADKKRIRKSADVGLLKNFPFASLSC